MAFVDDFAARLAEHGISVDPTSLPDQDVIKQSLDDSMSWFFALDPAVREGFDEGSREFAVCSLLATPDINVAPALRSLLEAFDQISGKSLFELLQIAQECAVTAEPNV